MHGAVASGAPPVRCPFDARLAAIFSERKRKVIEEHRRADALRAEERRIAAAKRQSTFLHSRRGQPMPMAAAAHTSHLVDKDENITLATDHDNQTETSYP
eukprot:248479-Pyramimonas_sp.AAC.2